MKEKIAIRFIGKENASDIRLKNERFRLEGQMLPCYQNGAWSYSITRDDQAGWDIFPDEDYDFEEMGKDHAFIGAYDGADCVGLAILEKAWYRYLYLQDLKVIFPYRRQHIATQMLEKACEYARQCGYRGIWTVAQSKNLGACLFYLANGFRIGGLDTETYNGTKQEGNADIHFYRELE